MDERKKLMVLIALIAVMACTGVFQVLKPHGVPPPPPSSSAPGTVPSPAPMTNTATPATLSASAGSAVSSNANPNAKIDPNSKSGVGGEKAPEIKNPQVANELPRRNPFEVPGDQRPKTPSQLIAANSRPKAFPPKIKGTLAPTAPMPLAGSFGQMSPLPGAMAPVHPKDEPFGYKLVGSINGDRSAVVLQDAAGNQKLVPEGASIDGDSRVKRVENGAVVIEYRGKRLRLTVGGTSVDKK
jgi:hypothetical protein